MAFFRKLRRGCKLHLKTSDGPIVVHVKVGRTEVEVEAPATVKINHQPRKRLTQRQRPV